MADVTVAEEEYLQILFWLQEAGLPMTGANVARAMQLSRADRPRDDRPPRARRLHHARRPTSRSRFTDSGREHAEGIVRRHRLIERFLTDVLGIPWDEVHEEAERLEHAMSPVLEERMLAAIGDAKTCPHGHPIVAGTRIEGVPLADVEVGRRRCTVLRFENEAEDLLHYLKDAGPRARASRARSRAPTTTRSSLDADGGTSCASRAASPRPSRWSPTRRRRRAPRCPSSSCSRATATGASGRASPGGRSGQPAYAAAGVPLSESYASARRATPSSICSGVTPGVGQAQRVLAALEQEVGALDERARRARPRPSNSASTSVPSGSSTHMK